MPIEITAFPTKPAVEMKRVHAVELRINVTQEQTPKAPVRLVYKLYGHDAQGLRHFDEKQEVISIDNAYTEAATLAMAGKPQLMNALIALEDAIAALVASTGKHGTATRVA
jgi:hypothetical protein